MKIKKVKVKDNGELHSKIYIFIEDESIVENLQNRHIRPYKEYRKLLPEIFKKSGINPCKAGWRQNCGCACGCSPGFVLDDNQGLDVFVEIKA